MSTRYWLFVGLVLVSVGCGRVGVKLLEPNAGAAGRTGAGGMQTAGRAGSAAGRPADAGSGARGGGPSPTGGASSGGGSGSRDAGLPLDAGPVDAGQLADAGDAAVDSAVLDAAGPDTGTLPACDGERVFGLCWYLGAPSASCNDTCAAHGGFDTDAISYVGTTSQGGSVAECNDILIALGQPGVPGASMRDDGFGLGCHVWPGGVSYWLDRPAFSPSTTASGSGVRIACGCNR